ncbi:MAG: HAMP domain-containing sensor histidine kinase, partial [Clostridia bacterium]
ERLKTELITNVSHDIKTPLTSIINYVDLISKEDCENEKIVEYTEVLARQSERLKKLIEDLVEASKVSTGNVEVALAPCDVGVLLSQTAGEYEQRLEASSLALILSSPKNPVTVMADGRLIWRVFDNLMNNVCKYSQPGTRVYLSLEVLGGEALVSLKNTSKSALNISSEELMERFVRGDGSRSTEGSGLGLSIAKSLTALQNGSLNLVIDGDLFKVTLKFKAL